MDFQLQKSTRLYLAGHTGLIGSAFLRRLRAESYTHLLTKPHSELDLRDAQAVDKFFAANRPEVVLMCAGRVGGILVNRDYPADFVTENLAITLNVIRIAHQYDVKRLIYFGSSCMYPGVCSQPMKEDALLTGKLEWTSQSHALSKLVGLEMCDAYNRQYGGNRFRSFILNNTFGPFGQFDPQKAHALSGILGKIHSAKVRGEKKVVLWGTGTPRREFIYVDDVVDAALFLISQREYTGPINIGTGRDYTIRELAEAVKNLTGYQGEIIFDASFPDGAMKKLLDCSRLNALGWKARYPLEEGLRRTYDWYLTEERRT